MPSRTGTDSSALATPHCGFNERSQDLENLLRAARNLLVDLFMDGMTALRKRTWIVALLLVGSKAEAVRTAVFPPELHNRTAIWLDQDRIFKNESSADKSRPIWLHAGDSIATSWSNIESLRDRMSRAEREALARAGSMTDMLASLPDASMTWYAGSKFNYGVLGALDRNSRLPWVVISTALAGAEVAPTILEAPRYDEDPFANMFQVKEPARVHLVTFSLGTNDACAERNPVSDETSFRAKLRKLRATFPQATFVPFRVIPVRLLYKSVMARLAELPNSMGRQRITEYCAAAWQRICPGATREDSKSDVVVGPLQTLYSEELGPLYDAMNAVRDMDVLDLLSGDCFHPSAAAEARLAPSISHFVLQQMPAQNP